MAHGWDGQAPPALVAVEEALHRGRYGIDADSYAAPQADSRTRRDVAAPRRVSSENCFRHMDVNGDVHRAVRCLYAHRPYIEQLYRRYRELF